MMRPAVFALITLFVWTASATSPSNDIKVSEWTQKLRKNLRGTDVNLVLQTLQTSDLLKSLEHQPASPHRQTLLNARKLYAKGQYKAAIAQYDRIPKGTDEWLEAVEEKGWAFYRQGLTDRSMAQAKTLLSPTFRGIVGTEPFYLQSLSQLKVCDYVSVLETHKLLRESQRERMVSIQELADKGDSPAVQTVLRRTDRFPLTLADLGDQASTLPRQFHRDVQVQKAMLQIRLAEAAIPVLQESAAQNPRYRSLSMRQIRRMQNLASKGRRDLAARTRTLGERETSENFDLLQKINIIEVETIQRVHIDQSLDRALYSKGEFSKTSVDHLVFLDDGHPWIDELDKFQVRLNACPGKVRRKM